MNQSWKPDLGAHLLGEGRCRFRVWAPKARQVEVEILEPREVRLCLDAAEGGYHEGVAEGVEAGSLYFYHLDGGPGLADPASRLQPLGVHGPSQVIEPHYDWQDGGWRGIPLSRSVLYEIHVGTFSREGTFDGVIPQLDRLVDLGVTAVELMPVAQFPGERNWGYDGVLPFAVQRSYGGPECLKKLVDACHGKGLAVVLDVVYNHLGPEGNYLAEFGPYFTDRYRTPWGLALNFDGPDSDAVRHYFVENALSWVTEYHLDGLRLDAVHAIADSSERPFLADLGEALDRQEEALDRHLLTFAESDLNTLLFLRSREHGGCGLEAQWTDDFHHSLHTLLTGERDGYYSDFGSAGQLAKSYREGFVYTGQYSPYRRRHHGVPAHRIAPQRHVVCLQNHDQVGNRKAGERIAALVPFEALKLGAAAYLLSPFTPLIWMGEEYGETAPFPYFVHHSDEALIEAVRHGRQEEFAAFGWQGEIPDPQAAATFESARLDPARGAGSDSGEHRVLFELYRELLRLRREEPALADPSKERIEAGAREAGRVVWVRRWTGRPPGPASTAEESGEAESLLLLSFGEGETELALPLPEGTWSKRLDTADPRWGGPGSPLPDRLECRAEPGADAEVRLRLAARSAALYVR
jgi:maltooligosyltrehalose trehalohydrolase